MEHCGRQEIWVEDFTGQLGATVSKGSNGIQQQPQEGGEQKGARAPCSGLQDRHRWPPLGLSGLDSETGARTAQQLSQAPRQPRTLSFRRVGRGFELNGFKHFCKNWENDLFSFSF